MKKIRGGKRHLQRLQKESTTPAELFLDGDSQWHYSYEKLGLAPWHWHHRQPPQLVRQLAAQHLLTTFFAWQLQLAELAEPFYLAVWIVGPAFAHSSQVAVGIRKMMERYHERLGEPDPDGPPLPAEYRELPGADKLIWQTYPWAIPVDSFDYPDEWPAWALQKPHYLCQPEDNDEYLMVQTGWVWVGRLRPAEETQF